MALILDHYGVHMRFKVVVIANLALCIVTSKMFAYYPVLIDLGAVALLTAAFSSRSLIATESQEPYVFWLWPRVSSLVQRCCSGCIGRFDRGAGPRRCGICRPSLSRSPCEWPPPRRSRARLIIDATMRYSLPVIFWRSPILYGSAFAYFVLTVFGGISILLWFAPALVRQASA